MVQGVGYPIHIDLHMGRLNRKVKPMPLSDFSKNQLECHLPQHQEHPRAKKNVWEPARTPEKP
jgi:hypothetical protein